jgi:Na+/melibiose symporter-like transporter
MSGTIIVSTSPSQVSTAPQHASLATWRLVAYGLAAIPIAMAALPIYVNVPKFYADVMGLNLAAIGGLLLAARIFDAVQDPLLGIWSDWSRGSRFGRWPWVAAGAPLLGLSMLGLFNPPSLQGGALMAWLLAMLLIVYTAFSMLQISYQAHGAEMSHDKHERTRIVAFREGMGLAGVFLAAALPQLLVNEQGARQGYATFAWIFIPVVLIAVAATISLSPRAATAHAAGTPNTWRSMLLPLKNPGFVKLLRVFVFNGIAASIPATLVLFFIEDVVQAPGMAAQFLIAYFAAGAFGMPLWVWLARRIGKGRAWLVGMLTSIIAFVWAFNLGAGDTTAFMVICILSGIGLGADLALPASILADVIDEDVARGVGRNEGAYFGLWNLVTKMNLALAAGIALPLLAWLGYTPSASNSATSLTWLAVVYALVPCVLKGFAVAALLASPFAKSPSPSLVGASS